MSATASDIDDATAPDSDDREAVWLQERLARRIWREDETPGRLVHVRIRQKRQSKKGTTAHCIAQLATAAGQAIEQHYLLHQFGPDAFETEADAVLADATILPRLGRPVTLLPETSAVLVAFPNDPHMRLVIDDELRAWLDRRATTLANLGQRGPRWRLGDATLEILRYAPGQRLTTRCRGHFVRTGGVRQSFGFIVKQFRKVKWARTLHLNLVALERQLARPGMAKVPRSLAFDGETGLVAMEELPGTDLKHALPNLDLLPTMRAAGRTLAGFHQARRRVSETVSVLKELEEVRQSAERIERFFPAAIPRLTACLSRCLTARWTDEVPTVLLHGAYRPKHVWVHRDGLALIDVDGIRMGHPAYDIGHFLSALYYLEAQEHFGAAERRASFRQFLEGYAEEAPWQLRPAAVLWYLAALLMHKQARKYVMHLHEDRAEKVDLVLRLAERALVACEELPADAPLDAIWDVLD
jgi:hypothetical protein